MIGATTSTWSQFSNEIVYAIIRCGIDSHILHEICFPTTCD